MEVQLLTNEAMVKDIVGFADNIAGNYLRPAMIEAQEIDLKRIIGGKLLQSLKDRINDNSIEDTIYQEVLNQSQFFLAYQTAAKLIYKVSFKVGNIGAVRTSDENVNPMTFEEVGRLKDYYQAEADRFCFDLQRWLCKHSEQLPELTDCDCSAIRSHLRTSYTCGLWLGGARGRRTRR